MADIVKSKKKRSWEELVSEGVSIREDADNLRWQLGKLAAECVSGYGEGAIQKLAIEIGVSYIALRQYRWIYEHIESVTAVTNSKVRDYIGHLSFTHLRLLAGTNNPQELVEEAIKNDWSINQLAVAIKQNKLPESEKELKSQPTLKGNLTKFLMDFFDEKQINISVEIIDELAIKLIEFIR